MKQTKLITIILCALLSVVALNSRVTSAASVEETCSPGEDGACASALEEEEDFNDDEEYDELEEAVYDGDCEDDDESCAMYARRGDCAAKVGPLARYWVCN